VSVVTDTYFKATLLLIYTHCFDKVLQVCSSYLPWYFSPKDLFYSAKFLKERRISKVFTNLPEGLSSTCPNTFWTSSTRKPFAGFNLTNILQATFFDNLLWDQSNLGQACQTGGLQDGLIACSMQPAKTFLILRWLKTKMNFRSVL